MNKRAQIFVAFGSVYVLWGSTFVAIRYATQLLHPAFVAGMRYLIAATISMGALLILRRPVLLPKADWGRVTLLGLLMFTVNTTLVSYAGKILPAGLTALFVASIPIFIAVLEAGIRDGTKMSGASWVGTISGFGGLGILTAHSVQREALSSERMMAFAALIVASIAWAVGSVLSRRMAFTAQPLVLSTWQMLIGGSVNVAIGVAVGGLRTSQWTRGAWLAMLYLAIFGSLAGYSSYMFLLRNVRISAAATYAYINPIVAVVLGWLFLHERLHGTEWLGMGVVLISVATVVASKERTKTAPAADSVIPISPLRQRQR